MSKESHLLNDPAYALLVRTMTAHSVGAPRQDVTNLGGLAGVARRIALHKAKLYIGLDTNKVLRNLVGKVYLKTAIGWGFRDQRTGALPPVAPIKVGAPAVTRTITEMRHAQVDTDKEFISGATISSASGVFEGGSEASIVVEIAYERCTKEPTPGMFHRHILRLAEHVASGYCQKIVLIEWAHSDRLESQRVSPHGLPVPGPELNDWEKARAAELGIEL